ncbi:MAG TPA: MarR family transcriptional regulator [Draconibacterium sp.]|nr:MarR family transcriptional regulator [Draconibacterium sp.]
MEKPLGYILGQIKRVYSNKLMARFKENNVELSLDLYIILFHIEINEEITQQLLADYLQKDKSFIMRQINSLTDKKYVVRTWNRQDKRKKNLVLTKSGYEKLSVMKTLARNVSDELLSGVNDEDQRAFQRVIDIILRNGASDREIFKKEND